jgi:hypothetical protein
LADVSTGEPSIAKSRLTEALQQRLEAAAHMHP